MASKRISRLVKILSGAVSDAEDEIYELEGRVERFAHFWVLVCKSFTRNRCPIRAAALSYSSLLALIPLLAVAISVTSSLLKQEGEDKIYQAIDQFVAQMVPPTAAHTNHARAGGHELTNQVFIAADDNAQNWMAATTNVDALASEPTNQISLAAGTNSITGTNLPAVAAKIPDNTAPVVSVNAQKTAAKSIHEFVQQTQSAKLGAIGMLLLVFVAIRMLANIEATFNDIWGVTRGRSWVWRIVLYWTTITLGPLALVGVLGLSGSSHLKTVESIFQQMPFIGSLIFDFLPLMLIWLIFALVYMMVPNTKVNFSAALVGGIVAGSAWHVNNMLGFLYASRVVTNSKIYGSLGLVPVFMIGLYFTWIILLFGAQVAYAFQNRKSYLQNKLVEHLNQRGREFVALRLMSCLAQRFQNGLRPPTISQLSVELGIPDALTQSVLRTLSNKRLVMEVAGGEIAYAPARPLETINAYDILHAIRTGNGQELPMGHKPALNEIYGEFARIENAERETASGISLLTLASRLSEHAVLPEPGTSHSQKQLASVQTVSEPENVARASSETIHPILSADTESAAPIEKSKLTEQAAAPATRREVVRPEEKTDFPL